MTLAYNLVSPSKGDTISSNLAHTRKTKTNNAGQEGEYCWLYNLTCESTLSVRRFFLWRPFHVKIHVDGEKGNSTRHKKELLKMLI